MSHVRKIQSKFFLSTNRKSVALLEGEYQSLLQGKSLNFDTLRDYNFGDDIRDIDWNATARNVSPLVKSYTANRRHNIVFVLDSSPSFQALAPDFTIKRDLSADIAGILGWLSVKHGDCVSVITTSTQGKLLHTPSGASERHLNNVLDTYLQQTPTQVVPVSHLLSSASKQVTTPSIVVVVSDTLEPSQPLATAIRTLRSRHDLIWVHVADINPLSVPSEYRVMDVETRMTVPASLRGDKALIRETEQERQQLFESFHEWMTKTGTPVGVATSEDTLINNLVALLGRRTRELK